MQEERHEKLCVVKQHSGSGSYGKSDSRFVNLGNTDDILLNLLNCRTNKQQTGTVAENNKGRAGMKISGVAKRFVACRSLLNSKVQIECRATES